VTTADDEPLPARAAAMALFGSGLIRRDEAVLASRARAILMSLGHTAAVARMTLERLEDAGRLTRIESPEGRAYTVAPAHRAVVDDAERDARGDDLVNTSWDGRWTLVRLGGLPLTRDQWRDVRSRLRFAHFAPVRNRVWLACGAHDLRPVLGPLGLDPAAWTALVVTGRPPTHPRGLADRYLDIDATAARYRRFLDRWTDAPEIATAADYVRLHLGWIMTVRQDPRLPVETLPADWPARPALAVFRRLADTGLVAARADEAASLVAGRAS